MYPLVPLNFTLFIYVSLINAKLANQPALPAEGANATCLTVEISSDC